MDISLIKPYDKNAKKHPKKQVQQIAASISKFGFNQPIVVDKNNIIIVGHGRYEAAKLLGLTVVPVQQVDLTDEQAKSYRLADNKLNESEWDMELVIQEMRDMSPEMVDLTGFDKDLLIEPAEKDDVVPPLPEEPKSKLGDIYQLGKHRIMCGDSTSSEDVTTLMNGVKCDMVFTDPPYGIALKVKKNYASRKKNKKAEEYEPILGDEVEFNMTKVFENVDSKKWWIWGADYLYKTIPKFRDGNLVVWAKRHSEAENKVFGSAFELCWVYPYCKKEIWFIRAINQSSEALGKHPTQKPTELGVRAISRNTDEGGVVVDVFLGSGSTIIACEKTKRICYGMELSPRYIDVIIERYENYTNEKAVKLN